MHMLIVWLQCPFCKHLNKMIRLVQGMYFFLNVCMHGRNCMNKKSSLPHRNTWVKSEYSRPSVSSVYAIMFMLLDLLQNAWYLQTAPLFDYWKVIVHSRPLYQRGLALPEPLRTLFATWCYLNARDLCKKHVVYKEVKILGCFVWVGTKRTWSS